MSSKDVMHFARSSFQKKLDAQQIADKLVKVSATSNWSMHQSASSGLHSIMPHRFCCSLLQKCFHHRKFPTSSRLLLWRRSLLCGAQRTMWL